MLIAIMAILPIPIIYIARRVLEKDMHRTIREMKAQAEKAEQSHRQQEVKIAELKEAVAKSQLDLEEERRLLNEERQAFEERLLATASTHASEIEREMDRQMGEEQERRVLRVTEQAARRLKKLGLSRGWQAWHSQHTLRAWRRRQFQGAVMRLVRPGQSHCLEHWRRMWQAGVAELQAQLHSKEQGAVQAGIAQLQAELRAVREAAAHAAKVAAKQLERERREAAAQLEATELASGRDLRDVERAAREAGHEEADAARAAQEAHAMMMEARLEAEKEARVAHIGLMAARRLGQQSLIKAWESWAQEYRTQRRQVRTNPQP